MITNRWQTIVEYNEASHNGVITTTVQNDTFVTYVSGTLSWPGVLYDAILAHKQKALTYPPLVLPTITLDQKGLWIVTAANPAASVAVTIHVPTGSSGKLRFEIDQGYTGTPQYSQNNGAFTSLTDGLILTFAEGDTLILRSDAIVGIVTGRMYDVDRNMLLDSIYLKGT